MLILMCWILCYNLQWLLLTVVLRLGAVGSRAEQWGDWLAAKKQDVKETEVRGKDAEDERAIVDWSRGQGESGQDWGFFVCLFYNEKQKPLLSSIGSQQLVRLKLWCYTKITTKCFRHAICLCTPDIIVWAWMTDRLTHLSLETERDAFDTLLDHAPDKLNVVKTVFSLFILFANGRETKMWEKWYIDFCLCCHQSLITFVNKHLNKLNLEVTELESQVGHCLDSILCWIESNKMYFLHRTVLDVVLVVMQSVYLWPVCWWSVPGSVDGATGRLLCPSVQLLPHPRELWAKGEKNRKPWFKM